MLETLLTPEEYQSWLSDPRTRAVFARGELSSRPATVETTVQSESDASYRLGYVTGCWATLDMLRNFEFGIAEEPDTTFENPDE